MILWWSIYISYMKTKIKILLLLSIFWWVYMSGSIAFSAWYGTNGPNTVNYVSFGSSPGTTNCPTDWQDAEIWPISWWGSPNPGDTGVLYTVQARINGSLIGSTMPCQMWDATNPNTPNINPISINVWDVTINSAIVGTDSGGAGLFSYTLEVQAATDSPTFTTWSTWSTVWAAKQLSPNFALDTKLYWTTPRAFRFRSTTYDRADNPSPTYTNPTVYIITAVGGWYGPSGPNSAFYDPMVNGVNMCLNDSQPETVKASDELNWPNPWPNGYAIYYTQQSRVNTILIWYPNSIPGMMPCQRWDIQNPTVTTFSYGSGWSSGSTIPLTFISTDVGWADVWQYDLEMMYSDMSPSFATWWTSWTSIATIPAAATSYAYTDATRPSTTNRAYKFRIKVRDNANNASPYMQPVSMYQLDTTIPIPANLSTTTPLNLLATNSQPFSFTFTDPGSPVAISSQIEDFNNSSLFVPSFNPSGYLNSFVTPNHNISIVDGWDRTKDSNTAREYTYRITSICDQAGNCWNGTQDINYNIYANPNANPVSDIQNTTSLAAAIADGQPRVLARTLKDAYNNAIIPAPAISRSVSMNLSGINNTMFLDQYTRTWVTSIYVTAPNNAADTALTFTSSQVFVNPLTSTTGDYPLILKVYTPTANSYWATEPKSDPLASFSINTNLVVSDSLIGPAKTFSQTLSDPSFKPLYISTITGDLRNGGFIEGTQQTNIISITNNNIGLTPSVLLQLEFSGSNTPSFDYYGWTTGNSGTVIAARNTMTANPGTATSTTFYTKLVQKPNTQVNSLSSLQFSTHFSYTLDGKNILYNSDIIGKTWGYWGGVTAGLGNQVGIKIIGPIASNIIWAILSGQFADGTSIFGGISRADARNKIRQSIALATRNMILQDASATLDTVGSFTSGAPSTGVRWAYIDKWNNTSILKLEKIGWNIILGSIPVSISGRRTLVVKWANLYISKDMYYATVDSILAVVVQKDEAGNGGNLYIDPNITNIVGTYIIDGSVMSYSDILGEIGVGDITTLKNQLYIYGSIVSENTIGGSRMSPLRCPSLINTTCATINEAQKYDLNYLRRYYLFGGSPFGNAKVIGGGTCTTILCSGFQANMIQKFTTPTEDLARYPVIIEYNPRIRTTPPIGFDLTRE